jgi:DNA-binding NtrC family response regulator
MENRIAVEQNRPKQQCDLPKGQERLTKVIELISSDQVATAREHLPSKGHVLIVDDDRFFTKVLKIILTGESFEVSCAANLGEARDHLRQSHFDVIISDLRMADRDDGIALLQELRAAHHTIPFIMLTGFGEVENYMVAMNAGATDFLNKPVQAEELLAVIERCLRRHEQQS